MSSLKDLARECGVSVATVSKALNGQHDISDATRARVREAAERLGYCLLYTSPSPRDGLLSRMPSSA